MKVIPARKTIVIKPEESSSAHGQLVVVQEKKQEVGMVVAIGETDKEHPLPIKGLKKGDKVAYRRFGEQHYFVGTEQYLFVSFDDILGVIKDA